jgi:hypothetical protein
VRCFVAALDQAFKANAVFKEWATSWITHIAKTTNSVKLDHSWQRVP